MLQFLENHRLPKLTQEEIDNLKLTSSITEVKFVVKNLSKKKTFKLMNTSHFLHQTFYPPCKSIGW